MSCLVVIPARGGSKGVPKKNLRPLDGKPLVAHAIGAARAAARVSRVVVSTDDVEIARTAERHGAEVVWRPSELASDQASSESALIHALDDLRQREAYEPELVGLLQCTAPLTLSQDLDDTISTLIERGADSCFTAVPFYHFLWQVSAEGTAQGINHSGARRQRRQDMAPQYLENGAFYLMRVPAFRESLERFCGRVAVCVVPAERCLEIDTLHDFALAEAVLAEASAHSPEGRGMLPAPVDALVMDFDGVLTDNRVLVFDDGREAVCCDRGDGLGLESLRRSGPRLLILSKEKNPVVAERARKLQIECLQGVDEKLSAMRTWLAAQNCREEHTIYVGNDVNDAECMRAVGFAVCPRDAHPSIQRLASLVLAAQGGRGAVRELCDLLATPTISASDV